MPEATDALQHLADLYGRVVYGASLPGQYYPEHLRLLWDLMSHPHRATPGSEEFISIHN